MTQKVPYLQNVSKPNMQDKESQQVAQQATALLGTTEQSQVRSAEAAVYVTQESVAKRQRVEVQAASKTEQKLRAAIEQ